MSAIKDVMFDRVEKVEKAIMDCEKALRDLKQEINYLNLVIEVDEIEDDDIKNFGEADTDFTIKRIEYFNKILATLR